MRLRRRTVVASSFAVLVATALAAMRLNRMRQPVSEKSEKAERIRADKAVEKHDKLVARIGRRMERRLWLLGILRKISESAKPTHRRVSARETARSLDQKINDAPNMRTRTRRFMNRRFGDRLDFGDD